MADMFRVELDTSALLKAFDSLGDAKLVPYTKPVAEKTAQRIRREQLARVHRRTGQRLEIDVREDREQIGYIVATSDVRSQERMAALVQQRKQFGSTRRGITASENVAHVGAYLEYGTVDMKARPFFWEAARLEEDAFDRGIREAVSQALEDAGLGG